MANPINSLESFPGSPAGQEEQLAIYLEDALNPYTPKERLTAPFNEGPASEGWDQIPEGNWGRLEVSPELAVKIAKAGLIIDNSQKRSIEKDARTANRAHDLLSIAAFMMAGQVAERHTGRNRGPKWRLDVHDEFSKVRNAIYGNVVYNHKGHDQLALELVNTTLSTLREAGLASRPIAPYSGNSGTYSNF